MVERDEMWSFVHSKAQAVGIWVAIERQTRTIVRLTFGDRAEEACGRIWQALLSDYRKREIFYTDGLSSYQAVLPSKRHRVGDKQAAQTTRVDRFHHRFARDVPASCKKYGP
jgi:IS1 family transposase